MGFQEILLANLSVPLHCIPLHIAMYKYSPCKGK